MTEPQSNDFLALEPILVDRLTQALADVTPAVRVVTAARLSDMADLRQFAPCVAVIHTGFRVSDNLRTDGLAALLEHTWLIVCAVKTAADVRSGKAAREQAGLLAAAAGGALMGLKAPSLLRQPLKLTTSPGAAYDAGFLYLPLAFTATTVFQSTALQP